MKKKLIPLLVVLALFSACKNSNEPTGMQQILVGSQWQLSQVKIMELDITSMLKDSMPCLFETELSFPNDTAFTLSMGCSNVDVKGITGTYTTSDADNSVFLSYNDSTQKFTYSNATLTTTSTFDISDLGLDYPASNANVTLIFGKVDD